MFLLVTLRNVIWSWKHLFNYSFITTTAATEGHVLPCGDFILRIISLWEINIQFPYCHVLTVPLSFVLYVSKNLTLKICHVNIKADMDNFFFCFNLSLWSMNVDCTVQNNETIHVCRLVKPCFHCLPTGTIFPVWMKSSVYENYLNK